MRVERVETVAAVKQRQLVWLPWMQELTEGLEDSDLVVTISQCFPFGTYLMDLRRA